MGSPCCRAARKRADCPVTLQHWLGIGVTDAQSYISTANIYAGTNREIGLKGLAVTAFGDAVAAIQLHSRKVALGDEVEHARNRVRAIYA